MLSLFPKLFNDKTAPLLKFEYKDRISYLFGSNHIVPLQKLSTDPYNIFKRESSNDFLINFLKDKKTLITESGYINIFEKKRYHLDYKIDYKNEIIENIKKSPNLNKLDDIINIENDFYNQIIKMHEIGFFLEYNLDNFRTDYKNKLSFFNISQFLKKDKLYNILTEI